MLGMGITNHILLLRHSLQSIGLSPKLLRTLWVQNNQVLRPQEQWQ